MSLRTSKTVRARALAGLITAVEIELVEAHANGDKSVRNDVTVIARDALMTTWKTLYGKLGDPFEFKQRWDATANDSSKLQLSVDTYTDAIVSDISPALKSTMTALLPTATVINPQIRARYAVSMV